MKAHAQNDAEFRAMIGDPKMGKVINFLYSLLDYKFIYKWSPLAKSA